MKKATKQFTTEQVKEIESAIREIELKTSAEVVPVVASSSGRYDRAEGVFALLFALLALILAWDSIQKFVSFGENWNGPSTLNSPLPLTILVLLVTYSLGIALASRLTFLRLPFVGKREMAQEVESRARETFQKLNLRATDKRIGILIYISLFEHRVHIVGDETINEKLSQNDWEAIRDIIVNGFKKGNPTDGLCAGIRRTGELLTHHFPIEDGDKNELPNKLHLVD